MADDPVLAVPSIGSKSYLDLGFGYTFRDWLTVRLNVNNALDTDPPQMANTVREINTDASTFDVFGRSYMLSMTAVLGQ